MLAAAKALLILVSIVVSVLGIEAAGRSDVLELAALPFALVLLALYRALGSRAECVAWVVFLFLLGLTYVDPAGASARELFAFGVCAALAGAGLLVSPLPRSSPRTSGGTSCRGSCRPT